MSSEILAISKIELMELNKDDFKVAQLGDFYLTRIIQKANELGLSGKKIKTIERIDSLFGMNTCYINFICEEAAQ